MLALDDDTLPPPPPRRVPVQMPWGLRVREWALGYLPLLMMALLALATWWLVKNTPSAPGTDTERPVSHVPDYTMNGFTTQRFAPTGALRVQIEGAQLRHYPDTDTFEIDNVRIRALGEDGSVTNATARRALSDGKGTHVQLLGSAQVVHETTDGREPVEFRGEALQLFTETERVYSDQPVQVLQGRNDIRAAGIDYDHRSRVAQLQGPIKARLDPPARRR
ncbi:LPS export ABC transporter periplasmic protein LptC [Azohydromonas australica]|uniref:LPS export ABC transporter periplasmic protein LptC n=1 Tax=Azohydromonas australica TaxID=364039 RepID=UPI0003F693E7|nr:LPS export ABC transporter periplasmic protein LptC [Azohydromonas australica]